MNEKVKRYVDNLFADIADSKQLRELKEEVGVNLAEKISDAINRGSSEEEAFKQAIAELGDISELAESMRKAANTRFEDSMFNPPPMDKKHVFGYVIASGVLLFGLLVAGMEQLRTGQLFYTISALLPFLITASAAFIYLALTQETRQYYAMNYKRALAYSLATALLLFGIMTAGIVYYNGNEPYQALAVFIPFVLPAVVAFIYLGLTEKSRRKVDEVWAREWMEKWTAEWTNNYNARNTMVRGGISGAIWLFSIAIFLLVGLNGGWKYSWIVFIFACGLEALIEAIFAYRRRTS